MVDGAFDGFGAAGRVELDEPRAFVQNIPDNFGDAVAYPLFCFGSIRVTSLFGRIGSFWHLLSKQASSSRQL